MRIDKTLKITIEQKDVEQAIRNLITAEDPSIVVDEIIFAAKRTGKDTISVKVDAHFGDMEVVTETAPIVEEAVEVSVPELPTDEEEAPFEVDDEAASEEEEEQPSPKQSLFG